MKLLKREFVTLFIFVFFILMGSISFATYQSAVVDEQKTKQEIEKMLIQTVELKEEEKETLELVNQYRMQNGLKKLKPLENLQQVAKLKAQDIVNNNYFSHNSEKLGTPFEMLNNAGVKYKIAGENLTVDYEYTGICVMQSPVYGKIFVQLFMGMN